MLDHLPGVFDGDVESVHQARVATRRLREVLPLISDTRRETSSALDMVRSAGRELGLVRELDVLDSVLETSLDRSPRAAVVVAMARRALRQRRLDARRAMVKAIERLDLSRLEWLVAHRMWAFTARWRAPAARAWAAPLRQSIAARAGDLSQAVTHATGVYFPNRAHRARIAVKKLRYAVEVAHDTALWTPPHLLKHLQGVQATLGDLHDVQVLIDRLDELVVDAAARSDLPVLIDVLQHDIVRHHATYVEKRERLFAISRACARVAQPAGRVPVGPLVAASLVGIPLLLLGQRKAG